MASKPSEQRLFARLKKVRGGRLLLLILCLLIALLCGSMLTELYRQQRNQDLIAAIKSNDATEVDSLLEAGADPDSTDRSHTSLSGSEAFLAFLSRMDQHREPDRGTPALELAVLGEPDSLSSPPSAGGLTIVESLLHHGAHPQRETTVLLIKSVLKAVITRDLPRSDGATVSLLLARGANANERDESGRTPLFYVQSPAVIVALVHYGADVNATDNEGRTPLHIACSSAQPNAEVIRCLLQHGAKANARNIYGDIPQLPSQEDSSPAPK